jgi:hypothetical protein
MSFEFVEGETVSLSLGLGAPEAVVVKVLASPSASTYVVPRLERAEERSRCKPGEESPNTAGRDAA